MAAYICVNSGVRGRGGSLNPIQASESIVMLETNVCTSSVHNPLSCHRARQKANTKKPKTNKTGKNTKKQKTQTRNKNKDQHGRWSADQFMDNWKMQEEMITLYHLRDWYGNVQKRSNKPQSAIQKSVSQEATDAKCGNQGSPPARSLEITECSPRATFSQIHGSIQEQALCCRIW